MNASLRTIIASAIVLALGSSGCAPSRSGLRLPTGTGTPLDAQAAGALWQRASGQCSGIRTLSADVRMSGRALGRNVRGRLEVGAAAPGRLRLEAPAPFGEPAVLLTTADGTATVLLPRDGVVVRDAPFERVLDALVGVPLTADDVRAVLAGCVTSSPSPGGGAEFPGGWSSITLGSGATAWVHQVPGGTEQIAAGVLAAGAGGGGGRIRVDYVSSPGPASRSIRLVLGDPSASARPIVDLTLELSKVETNIDIGADAFEIKVPDGVRTISIDELRTLGPLAERGQ